MRTLTKLQDLRMLSMFSQSAERVDRIIAGSDMAQVDALVCELVAKVPALQQELARLQEMLKKEQQRLEPTSESLTDFNQAVRSFEESVAVMQSSLNNLRSCTDFNAVDAAVEHLACVGLMLVKVTVSAATVGSNVAVSLRQELAEHALQEMEEVCHFP
jgi:septal ring factor EnvC (AmiA/AmiB activator)